MESRPVWAVFFGFLFFSQVFLGCGKHKLNPVELIDLACAGIVVDSDDICKRMLFTDFLNHAFSDNMVWQAAKGLYADNIICSGINKLKHFPC